MEGFSLSGELNFVNYRLRVGICWRGVERQKMKKEGFEGEKEGLDHWPRQRFAIESRRDSTDVKTEIKTDVEIEFFRG